LGRLEGENVLSGLNLLKGEIRMRTSRLAALAVMTVAVFGLAVVPVSTLASGTSGGASLEAVPQVLVGPVVSHSTTPPTGAECLAVAGIACYRPADLQAQYDFGPLYAAGNNGNGQTIVIFDAFGSPTIRQDLATFDTAFGLPAPPSFNVYMPEGNVNYNYTGLPSPVNQHNKNVATKLGWAYETTLDVDWAHAMAPGASIDLVVTPIPETEGVQGIPNLQNAQSFALSHGLGAIWSNSWSATEQGFHNTASIGVLDKLYAQASTQGITAFFATGDNGVANPDKQGRVYPFATVTYPPSGAHVVSVGGTEVTTPTAGISSYQPESVWNDGRGAGGGGYSTVFGEPAEQTGAGIPDPSGMRGLPDVSMNAAVISAVLIYESFDPTVSPGWALIAGTSEATPLWAGTDAVMNQADGSLGFLLPRLYQIYENPALYSEAFHDITVGNNSFGGIAGYSAGTGWDPATGLGTPDAAGLADALSHTTPTP
jgi:subtilase family serine protease